MDIISYAPLQSEVFHDFRSVGNAIVFVYLLDRELRTFDQTLFNINIPFLGINLGNLSCPMASESGALAKAVRELHQTGDVKDLAQADHVATNAYKADFLNRRIEKTSLFKAFAERLEQIVVCFRGEWDCATPEHGAVMCVDKTTEFYRLWSALTFIYCSPPERGQGEYDCYDLFGDGFSWAGAAIIFYLQQKDKFKLFDFCNHILNINEVFEEPDLEKSPQQFLANARRTLDVTQLAFDTLENFTPYVQAPIVQILPPYDDGAINEFQIVATLRETVANEFQQPGDYFDSSSADADYPVTPAEEYDVASSPPPPPPFVDEDSSNNEEEEGEETSSYQEEPSLTDLLVPEDLPPPPPPPEEDQEF